MDLNEWLLIAMIFVGLPVTFAVILGCIGIGSAISDTFTGWRWERKQRKQRR